MNDFRINWQLPAQPLGPAVRVEPEKEECPFSSFYTNTSVQFSDGTWGFIEEKDCKQINGAAQASQASGEVAPSARPGTPEAAPPFKVGDRVRCTYKHSPWAHGVIDMVFSDCARVQHDDGVTDSHAFECLEHA